MQNFFLNCNTKIKFKLFVKKTSFCLGLTFICSFLCWPIYLYVYLFISLFACLNGCLLIVSYPPLSLPCHFTIKLISYNIYPSWPNSSVHDTNRNSSSVPTELCALFSAFKKSSYVISGTSNFSGGTSYRVIRSLWQYLHTLNSSEFNWCAGVPDKTIGQYGHWGYSIQGE